MQPQNESINHRVDEYARQRRWSSSLPQPVIVMLSSLVFGWLVTTAYSVLGQPIPWLIWLVLGAAVWTVTLVAYLRRTQ